MQVPEPDSSDTASKELPTSERLLLGSDLRRPLSLAHPPQSDNLNTTNTTRAFMGDRSLENPRYDNTSGNAQMNMTLTEANLSEHTAFLSRENTSSSQLQDEGEQNRAVEEVKGLGRAGESAAAVSRDTLENFSDDEVCVCCPPNDVILIKMFLLSAIL